jgi:hypothetical protein
MAKGQTPEQKFKQLFNLSFDESTTQWERDTAQRKWREWLKRHNKTSNDIPLILAKAVQDDDAANPHPPPPDPRDHGAASPEGHPFDDANHDPASLIEQFVRQYLTMSEHVLVVFVLSIAATHIYEKFSVAPRVLFTSEEPDSGKSTALEIARSLMYRANEESFATAAAIRDHLGQTLAADSASCSIALDEGDLLEATARAALLLLWNLGHAKGAKHSLMSGGRKKLTNLFAPMFAAGLGRILGPAQLSRTFVLRMRPYDEKTKPELDWWAPGDEGDTAESRKETIDTFYRYLRHWAATRKFRLQPRMPAGIIRRSADNFRSLLSVADVCGGNWPQRAREALITLVKETIDDQPKAIILRHGLLLFERLDTDVLDVGLFNRELHKLSEPEFDWNRYCSPTGINRSEHPISISEQGRLLAPKVRSHPTWPPGRSQRKPGDCKRVLYRSEFEAARKTEATSAQVLRLKRPAAK